MRGWRIRIGELADALSLNTKTIRYYESIDVLPAPERTASGYRDYGAEDVERLSFVRTAQRLGLTLDEIREVIAFRDRGERPCGHVQAILRRQVVELGRRIEEMQQLREELSRLDEDAERIRQTPGTYCGLIEHVAVDRRRDEHTAEVAM